MYARSQNLSSFSESERFDRHSMSSGSGHSRDIDVLILRRLLTGSAALEVLQNIQATGCSKVQKP